MTAFTFPALPSESDNVVPTQANQSPIHVLLSSPPARSRTDYRQPTSNAAGRIVGTVKEKNTPTNVPLRRRVRLYRERDGALIRETWSDAATGAYVFEGLNETEEYTAMSYDHTRDKRAVVADRVPLEIVA